MSASLLSSAPGVMPQVGVLSLTGADAARFLHGTCTADVTAWAKHPTTAPLYTCHLSPQGRVVADFFVFKSHQQPQSNTQAPTVLHLQCHHEALMPLAQSLHPYSIGQQVQFHDASADFTTDASLTAPTATALPYGRTLLANHVAGPLAHMPCGFTDGVQSGARALPAELGFTHLSMGAFAAVSFKKGCYVGQEVTTRLHHLGQPKRQLVAFSTEGHFAEPPQTGEFLETAEGKTAGHVGATWQAITTENRTTESNLADAAQGHKHDQAHSHSQTHGRALVKLSAMKTPLFLRGSPVTVQPLAWWPTA